MHVTAQRGDRARGRRERWHHDSTYSAPLLDAALYNEMEAIDVLMEAGANIEARADDGISDPSKMLTTGSVLKQYGSSWGMVPRPTSKSSAR